MLEFDEHFRVVWKALRNWLSFSIGIKNAMQMYTLKRGNFDLKVLKFIYY